MAIKCERHTAAIYDRGGKNRLGQIEPIVKISYGRKRDDMSQATVAVSKPSVECLNLVDRVAANRHELVIFRGGERVWEGPISLITKGADYVEFQARDVGYYVYRTVAHAAYDSYNGGAGTPVVDRAYNMLVAELARKEALDPPINVVDHITKIRADDIDWERQTLRSTDAYSMTVFDDIDSLAQTGGLDYTVIGRRIILNDTRVPVGQTPPVTAADFIGEVILSEYGMDSATRAYTVGDAGMYGVAGGIDAYFGEWEIIEQMFDEDSMVAPSQAALDRAAYYNLIGRPVPPPILLRVPENSRLNPNGVLSMKDLVPGVRIPLSAKFSNTRIVQMQKLNTVNVTETAEDGEIISVSMVTAPLGLSPDDAPEE